MSLELVLLYLWSILQSPCDGNLRFYSHKYKQFTSKYDSRVIIYATRGFTILDTTHLHFNGTGVVLRHGQAFKKYSIISCGKFSFWDPAVREKNSIAT